MTFSVATNEVFGLLGPNGAGKTTTLAMLEGLRHPDAGSVTILGLDMARNALEIKARIGVQLQYTGLIPDLTALEQLVLMAELQGAPISRPAAFALLDLVGLETDAGKLPRHLSGGQQKRLALALALIGNPEIVFLDEPTAGLDPLGRHAVWRVIRGLRDDGRTVVLTTHAMEEAEALCDRVGIIDRGSLLVLGTPGELVNRYGGASWISTAAPLPIERLRSLPGVIDVQEDGAVRRLRATDVSTALSFLLDLARQNGEVLSDLTVRQPSLEDVFLEITGRALRDV